MVTLTETTRIPFGDLVRGAENLFASISLAFENRFAGIEPREWSPAFDVLRVP